ncbi:MAG: hypothetical protein J5654_07640 [Victivallales bacterium]|nr:hypothetical protein [Victivallales bacterium]
MKISRKIWFFLTAFLFAGSLLLRAAVVPASSQTLELKRGWNLVTLTHPITAESALRFLALQPMTLDADKKSYVRCTSKDELKVGVGYWIFSPTAQPPIDLVHDRSQTSYETAGLTADWSLIGVAKESSWQGEATDIWQWLDGCFQKISKEGLTEGNAYWVSH